MPPSVKITEEKIIDTAIDIVRREGVGALNARRIASELCCSTQPIFSNFSSMDDLKNAVVSSANEIYKSYSEREMAQGKYPVYKASGMAYIGFAKAEKELFKLLFMRDRSSETIGDDSFESDKILDIVQSNLGVSKETAKLFHLEMWVYVHGVASMFATGYLGLDESLVSRMLTDVYLGLVGRYETYKNER